MPRFPLLRGSLAQRLRITTGLVMYTFILFHFLNHALGIWSVEAMEAMQVWRTAVTRSVLGTTILATSLTLHIVLNVSRIAQRRTWRMPPVEALRIVLGLAIPIMLFPHMIENRGSREIVGFSDVYSNVLPALWPERWDRQTILLLVAWTHASIGLHIWLRLSATYRRLLPLALAYAVLVPTLGITGFVVGGRDADATRAAKIAAEAASRPAAVDPYGDDYGGSSAPAPAADPYGDDYGSSSAPAPAPDPYGDDYGSSGTATPAPPPAARTPDDPIRQAWAWVWGGLTPKERIDRLQAIAWNGTFAVWACLVLIFLGRWLARRIGRRIAVSYAAGPRVVTPIGASLLEISRRSGVPHTSVCGGRARCSTCRVRVDVSDGPLPRPGAAERSTLKRIGAPAGVRLACQLSPRHDLAVTRLVAPPERRGWLAPSEPERAGTEERLAILFLDIRGFTKLSEKRLPYDVVFLLNRFFDEIGDCVQEAGGWIDKYMGDGLIALFGRNQDARAACIAALSACRAIDAALDRINPRLASELDAPLEIGLGLNFGSLILGEIGHRASASLTVIGSSVNTASRLEALCKSYGAQLVVAAEVLDHAGIAAEGFRREVAEIRGLVEPLAIVIVPRAILVPEPRATPVAA